MTTTSMNQVFSMSQNNVQTQQSSGMGATKADTAKATDFSQYMKASTADTNSRDVSTAKVQGKVTERGSVTPSRQENDFNNASVTKDADKATLDGSNVEKLQNVTESQTEDKTAEQPSGQEKLQSEDTKEDTNRVKQIQFGDIIVSFECLQEIMPEDVTDTESDGGKQSLWIQLQVPEQIKEAFSQIKEKLVAKVAESFDVPEEDVVNAMEQLAMNVLDFLQQDSLKDLAITVTGEESKISLVTDESLMENYQTMCGEVEEVFATLTEPEAQAFEEVTEVLQKAEDTINGLSGQLDVTKSQQTELMIWSEKPQITMEVLPEQPTAQTEELPQAITELVEATEVSQETAPQQTTAQQVQTDALQADNFTEVSKVSGQSAVAEELPNPVIRDNASDETVEQADGQNMRVEVTVEDSAKEQVTEEHSEKQQGEDAQSQPKDEKTQSLKTTGEAPAVHSNTTVQTITTENQVQTIVKTQESSYDGIVRQIVEQVKVEFKPDTVSMELQLTPENLGKVKLHVASKEGMITAQLFVQNEAVKNAMEAQLMVLRDAMQQQGIKVEAVEVTVQTGAFAENLEQNSQQRKKEAENESKSYQKKGINLLQGLDEDSMNEEELLRAHIMQESGNSVDMNA